MRQLLKLRYPEPMTLIEGISQAGDVEALRPREAGKQQANQQQKTDVAHGKPGIGDTAGMI